MTDIEDWAKAQLTPSTDEITHLQVLIRCIETDTDGLSVADQSRLADAVTVIRQTRQVEGPDPSSMP